MLTYAKLTVTSELALPPLAYSTPTNLHLSFSTRTLRLRQCSLLFFLLRLKAPLSAPFCSSLRGALNPLWAEIQAFNTVFKDQRSRSNAYEHSNMQTTIRPFNIHTTTQCYCTLYMFIHSLYVCTHTR